MIGINQDNRADGSGKAGLTFQAIGAYNIKSAMNTTKSNAGGWRDTLMRKNLNDESNGTIWNSIQSTDFKNNITPVLKTTNNNANNNKSNSGFTSNASSITADKLWIISPSEMSMPVIKNYNVMNAYYIDQRDANVHYYDLDSYKNAIKSSSDGNRNNGWHSFYSYIYAGNAYQWWMLPAGSRKMSNGSQAYHNTDSYSYCALGKGNNPSLSAWCDFMFILFRSAYSDDFADFTASGMLYSSYTGSIVLAFSF